MLNELFIYDETSKTCLRWRHNRYNPVFNNIVKYAGDVAGCLRFYKDGLPKNSAVYASGKSLYIHRVIWEMINGSIPEGCVIDHIDGNPHNNLLSNLRLIKADVNSRNLKMPITNRSGKVGVCFSEHNNAWRAFWHNGKGSCRSKYFYIDKLGESAFEEAVTFRDNKIKELNDLGLDYTERHGTKCN